MSNRAEFRTKLSGILEIAQAQGKRISMEEVERYFADDNLSEEQTNLVCDYLLSQKVIVSGYEKKGSIIFFAEGDAVCDFTEEEKEYLEEYEQDLKAVRAAAGEELEKLFVRAAEHDSEAKQRLIETYLPVVVEIAKTQHHPEIFLGDMVQEGNVSLMLAVEMIPDAKGADAFLRKEILQGIQALQESYTEEKNRDNRMVEKVNELDASITKLTEEMGRKITIEELSMFMDIPVDEIVSVMQLAGEDIEVGEVNPEDIFKVSENRDVKAGMAEAVEDAPIENYEEQIIDGFDDMEYKPGE